MADTEHKVALVTGASSGIGKACAEHLAADRVGMLAQRIVTRQAGAATTRVRVVCYPACSPGVIQLAAPRTRPPGRAPVASPSSNVTSPDTTVAR